MALVKGPFTIVWGEIGDNAAVIHDVEEVDISIETETNDYTTVDGKRYTLYGAISANATLTLLDSNLDALTALLPQYTRVENTKMSSGETVKAGYAAIDLVAASCGDAYPEKKDLHIISCSSNGGGVNETAAGREVITIKSCGTSLTEVELPDSQVRTVQITFTGEPGNDGINEELGSPVAALQMYRMNALQKVESDAPVSGGGTPVTPPEAESQK